MSILFGLGAVALAGIAMAMILPALLNRRPVTPDDSDRQNIHAARRRLAELEATDDPDDAARAEIEAALLDDLADAPQPGAPGGAPAKTPGKVATALIVLLVPALGAGLYLLLGNPDALWRHDLPSASAPQVSSAQAPPVEELIRQLEQKLAENPDNAEGWALAGQTYMRLGRFADAEQAYRNLHGLVGDDPGVLTAWADAAVMAHNGAFPPEVVARIELALEIAPQHDNALWLAALAAESLGEHRRALAYLQRLLPLLENNQPAAAAVEEFIGKLRRLTPSATNGADPEGSR